MSAAVSAMSAAVGTPTVQGTSGPRRRLSKPQHDSNSRAPRASVSFWPAMSFAAASSSPGRAGGHHHLRVLQGLRLKNSLNTRAAPTDVIESAKFELLKNEYDEWKRGKQTQRMSPSRLSRTMPGRLRPVGGLDLEPAIAPVRLPPMPKMVDGGVVLPRKPVLAPVRLGSPSIPLGALGADPSSLAVAATDTEQAQFEALSAQLKSTLGVEDDLEASRAQAACEAASPSAEGQSSAQARASPPSGQALAAQPVAGASTAEEAEEAEAAEAEVLTPFASVDEMLDYFPKQFAELWKLSRLYKELR